MTWCELLNDCDNRTQELMYWRVRHKLLLQPWLRSLTKPKFCKSQNYRRHLSRLLFWQPNLATLSAMVNSWRKGVIFLMGDTLKPICRHSSFLRLRRLPPTVFYRKQRLFCGGGKTMIQFLLQTLMTLPSQILHKVSLSLNMLNWLSMRHKTLPISKFVGYHCTFFCFYLVSGCRFIVSWMKMWWLVLSIFLWRFFLSILLFIPLP